jgi:predicted Holliday junction resolvase-like endonuclease
MKLTYVKTMDFEVNIKDLVDSIFNYNCNLEEALAEQDIDDDLLEEIFTKETAPKIKEQLKYEMAKELLSETVGKNNPL